MVQANPIWPVQDRFPQLEHDASVDVAIIGGGIAGISCGFFLQEAGYTVHILEMEEVGCAATGASSGILYYGSGTNFTEAIGLYGKADATALWRETEKTIVDICSLVEEQEIKCGLRRTGAVMVAKDEEQRTALEEERAELDSVGVKCQLYDSNEVGSFFTTRKFIAGISFDICAQIHPANFAAGLAKRFNLPVFEYTPMEKFEEQDDHVIVRTPKAKVSCGKLIVAANLSPFFGLEKHFSVESSTIIASPKLKEDNLRKIWPQEKLIWGMEEKYDIIYPHDGRLILEVYSPKDVPGKLSYYYQGTDFKIEDQWGDSWSKTKDWLPIIGQVRPNIYAAVAMGDQGIVMGFTAGRKIQSSLEGRDDTILRLTSPQRLAG